MVHITSLEAFLLKELAQSNAELFIDRQPNTLYINNLIVDELEILPILQKFIQQKLLEENHFLGCIEMSITDRGKLELTKVLLLK